MSMFLAGMWAYAQAPLPPPVPRVPQSAQRSEPTVIMGNDVGFRVESRRGNTIVGRFVVRMDGRWLDVEESMVTKRVTTP
jgi:hypothetical protein